MSIVNHSLVLVNELIERRFENISFDLFRWNTITLCMSTWKFRCSIMSSRKSCIDYCWSSRYENRFKRFLSLNIVFLGWTPIHHAAYCDHVPILRLLFNKHPELLEQTTDDKLTFTKAKTFSISFF